VEDGGMSDETEFVTVPREVVAAYARSTNIPRHRRICEVALAREPDASHEAPLAEIAELRNRIAWHEAVACVNSSLKKDGGMSNKKSDQVVWQVWDCEAERWMDILEREADDYRSDGCEVRAFHRGQKDFVVPSGYFLISESALRSWGKLDEVRESCGFANHACDLLSQADAARYQWLKKAHAKTLNTDDLDAEIDARILFDMGGK
jgi:hypothetical protein